MSETWLPGDFVHPKRVELPSGQHLRPIRADDTELDLVAVMGSRERLWSMYGEAWGWPPATMTAEQDREDLQHHADEMERNESFNYALFDEQESELLGCVYIEPTDKPGADADVMWWVVDPLVGSEVEQALDDLVPLWIASDWPFEQPRYVGHDLSFEEWLAIPREGRST
ncbi:GNAT family N-acetyltransferase [Nocardioides mesophilus]|uniref:N-acetyltransferase n=1 Tax=Nocardioides mesophilus TaxID=433659 RepID=A0A7G9RGA0_9ACTN|nr:N-acetyltransferase [Nocardioides mesophilus]QNN54625.1 N-acetyltransferase [Nocardioides mesophilus]